MRIWPGRYPTQEQECKYGNRLAPLIASRMATNPKLRTGCGLDGKMGHPTDPARYNEDALNEKFLDKGPEDFALQYMLDTSLADALKQQLKLEDLVVANFSFDSVPEIVSYQATPSNQVKLPDDFVVTGARMYYAAPVFPGVAFVRPKERRMFIDPAGGGGDEIGLSISAAVGPYIHVPLIAGLRGGMSDSNMEQICEWVREFSVENIRCESNMGHGAFEKLLMGYLLKAGLGHVGVTGEYSSGQKERRIINRLVSPLQRHRVVIYPAVLEMQDELGKQYSNEKRAYFHVLHQLANITTDHGSLEKDDRLEAFAGAVSLWHSSLVTDEDKEAEKRKNAASAEFIANPMGYGVPTKSNKGTASRAGRRRGR